MDIEIKVSLVGKRALVSGVTTPDCILEVEILEVSEKAESIKSNNGNMYLLDVLD